MSRLLGPVGLVALAAVLPFPAWALTLVDNGEPVATIVLPPEDRGFARSAASLIQHCCERSSGAKLEIVTTDQTPKGVTIEVGATPSALAACPEAGELKTDGIIVRVKDGRLFVTAQNSYAVRIAAVRFLEQALGARWLFPGELGEIVPVHATISVPDDFNLVEEPDLESRMFSGMFGADPALWRLHLTLQFHHNLIKVVPVEKYGQTHPEYYPMIGGKRRVPEPGEHGWQPETTNPEVVQLAIAAADKWFTDNPEEISFSLGVNDSRGESYSPAAVALDEQLGPPTPTNRFYYFYNQVAEGLEKKWPNKLLGVLNSPPLHGVPTVPLHKNLLVYCWRGSDGGKRPAEWYGKWHNLCFCDWLYGCFYRMPRHYPHAYADLIRYYRQGGFRGMYAEAYPNWPIDGAKLYALSRVMWKLDTDVTATVDEYLRLAFGPASKPAGRFFAIAEKAMDRRDPPDVFSKWGSGIVEEFGVWNPEDITGMENAARAMEAAVAKEPESDHSKRVKLFRDGWDWYAVHMRMYVEAMRLQALQPTDADALAEMLSRTERLTDLPGRRERLWDEVVSKQKNVLWGTDRYREIITASDPALRVQNALYDALGAIDTAWRARLTPAEVVQRWAEARRAYPGLAAEAAVREQIAAKLDQANNLVVNPGFEKGLEGWGTWVRPGTTMEVRLDDTQAHSGKSSAYLGEGVIACCLQDIKVQPGDTFYVSCWARRAADHGVCALKVWWQSPDKQNLDLPQRERRAGDRPGEWQKLELYGQVPEKAGVAEILLLGQDHAAGDACWFDDVMCLVVPNE